jgi:hypothetical protein
MKMSENRGSKKSAAFPPFSEPFPLIGKMAVSGDFRRIVQGQARQPASPVNEVDPSTGLTPARLSPLPVRHPRNYRTPQNLRPATAAGVTPVTPRNALRQRRCNVT